MKTLFSVSLIGIFSLSNAQLTTIKEHFSDFVIDKTAQSGRKYGELPQNNWSGSSSYPLVYVSQNAAGSDNKYIALYNAGQDNPLYLFSPELISTEGKISFVCKTGGEADAIIQIGTITNPKDQTTYSAISDNITLTGSDATYEVEIPKNTDKYIAFKVLPPANKHNFTSIDDVVFTPKNLSTHNTVTIENRFAVSGNELVFSNENIHHIQILSANGNLITTTKVLKNKVDISQLSTGAYFLIIEDKNGTITQSKFIKN